MHYLVTFIVEGVDAIEAKGRTGIALEELIEQHDYDWYAEKAHSRWENCWKAISLETKAGLEIVNQALSLQLSDYKSSMAAIRYMLENYDDEQIFEEDFKSDTTYYLSRYQLNVASGFQRGGCQLYDQFGCNISNRHELESYTTKPNGLWVVQVDCHS